MGNATGHAVTSASFAGNRRRQAPSLSGGRSLVAETTRYLGAASILVVGAIHAQQYYDAYFRVVAIVAALGAIGIALGTFVSLLISEYMPLFGFMESGYRLPIVVTLVFDGLTTVFLGLFLLLVGPPLFRVITHERRTR